MQALFRRACSKICCKVNARKCYILSLAQKIVFFNEIFASCAILTLQTKPIGVLCSAFSMSSLPFCCVLAPSVASYFVHSACIVCRPLCSHCSDERRCYRRLSFVNCVRIKRGPRHKPSLRLFVVGRAEACVAFMLQGSILCDCIAERENIGSQEPPIASLPGVFMRRYPFRISQILAFP